MIQAIDLFKALSDATRLKIVMLIQLEGELCVCELMVALADSQPKISRHLAQLKKIGLLLDRRQKQWVYYRLNPELKDWMLQTIMDSGRDSGSFLEENRDRLKAMSDRPNNCCN